MARVNVRQTPRSIISSLPAMIMTPRTANSTMKYPPPCRSHFLPLYPPGEDVSEPARGAIRSERSRSHQTQYRGAI